MHTENNAIPFLLRQRPLLLSHCCHKANNNRSLPLPLPLAVPLPLPLLSPSSSLKRNEINYVTLNTYVCFHCNNLSHKGNGGKQQQWQPNNGNDCGNNSSSVGKCSTHNSKYFEINLYTAAMAVAITAPTVEAAALR
jgi:hypothetical protein